MKPHEIEKAAQALRKLSRAEEALKNLGDKDVIGITLTGDLKLYCGMRGSTGWLSDIGYPELFKAHMTSAMRTWFENEVKLAKVNARAAGVEFEEER